jgi:hypothetical protein
MSEVTAKPDTDRWRATTLDPHPLWGGNAARYHADQLWRADIVKAPRVAALTA